MANADSNGTQIYWEQSGEGEPLLLIMGLGYTHDMWHRTRPILAEKYRVIEFDNRGVGKSDVPPGPYSIAQMTADAAAVLDAAGVHAAHVLGISMGGMIAQEFVLTYPDRVKKLILAATACGGPKVTRAEKEVNDVLMARGTMNEEQVLTAALPYIYDPSTPRERIDQDLAIRRRTIPAGSAYMAQLMGILSWQSYDRLSQIKAPTLIIHGETDRLVPPANGKLIAETIPGSRCLMLPNASHLFTTDQPDVAHKAILDYLAE